MIDAIDESALIRSVNEAARALPPPGAIGFGKHLGPAAVVATHEGHGWSPLKLAPLASCSVPIAASAVHYALSTFEGLKAFRGPDGAVHLVRPDAHARRLAASAARLCIPPLGTPTFVSACALAVQVHEPLVPAHGQGSLYVRPILTGAESFLGVRASTRHALHVLVAVADVPRKEPLRVWVERGATRAAPGGLGAVKTGANYAAGLFALEAARARGFDQVLFMAGPAHDVVSETASSNVFFVCGSTVVTPPLEDTLLAGVTRDTCLRLLRGQNLAVEERAPTLDEVRSWHARGALREVFCCGTAASVVSVASLSGDGFDLPLDAAGSDASAPSNTGVTGRLRSELDALLEGRREGPAGFRVAVGNFRAHAESNRA